MKTEHYERVEQFMLYADQECPRIPTIPEAKIRALRAHLILEEALETIAAMGITPFYRTGMIPIKDTKDILFHDNGNVDIIEVADGCADISVVTIGTLIAFGIKDEPVLQEVDWSNLTKFQLPTCPDCDSHMLLVEAEELWYCDAFGDEHHTRPMTDGPHKRRDGKHVKPPYWKPPNIRKVLEEQGWRDEETEGF